MYRRHLLPLLFAFAVTTAGCNSAVPPAITPKPPEVVVARAVEEEVTDFEEFQGKTEAEKAVDIRAHVSGYLDRFNFRDGAEVRANDVLFQIDPRPFEAELARTEANVAQADAHLSRLESDYTRAQQLLPKNGISREDYDKAVGDLAEGRASLKAARAARDMAQLNLTYSRVTAPIGGRISRRFVDPGNMVKADDTILTRIVSLDWMYAYFDIDERTHLRIQRFLEKERARLEQQKFSFGLSHFILQTLGAGARAPGGVPIGSLVQPLAACGVMHSEVFDPRVPVTMGLQDEEGFPRQGYVDFVDNRVDPDSGSVWLRGVFPNADRLLTPGLYVRVRLPVGEAHRAVLIPERGLATDQGEKFVWVVHDVHDVVVPDADGKERVEKHGSASYRKVRLGAQHGTQRVVEQGIAEGELVIVSGMQRVRKAPGKDYAEVTIVPE
jgi:RND family efflux transporter MFP subunit